MKTPRFVKIIGGVSLPGYSAIHMICGLTEKGEVFVFKATNSDMSGQWIKLKNTPKAKEEES
jgi:hypothetical protein